MTFLLLIQYITCDLDLLTLNTPTAHRLIVHNKLKHCTRQRCDLQIYVDVIITFVNLTLTDRGIHCTVHLYKVKVKKARHQ